MASAYYASVGVPLSLLSLSINKGPFPAFAPSNNGAFLFRRQGPHLLQLTSCSVVIVIVRSSVPSVVWGVINISEVGIVEWISLGWSVVVSSSDSVIKVVGVTVSSVGKNSWSNVLESESTGGSLESVSSPLSSVEVIVVIVVSVELVGSVSVSVSVVGHHSVNNEVILIVMSVVVLCVSVVESWGVVVVSWEIVIVTACSKLSSVVPEGLVVFVEAELWSVGWGSLPLWLVVVVIFVAIGLELGSAGNSSKSKELVHFYA